MEFIDFRGPCNKTVEILLEYGSMLIWEIQNFPLGHPELHSAAEAFIFSIYRNTFSDNKGDSNLAYNIF